MLRILFDENHNPILPKILLANKSGKSYGILTNVYALNVTDAFSDTPSFTCKISKYENGNMCQIWDKITDFRLAYCVEWDAWFEITVELDDGKDVIKSITANGLCQAELSQINLYEYQINTEDDIARDDYVLPTVFYNEDDPSISLLNRILEKAPHYSIGFVDYSLRGIQRTFEFDGKSIKDALDEIAEEIGCIFIYENGNDMDKSFHSNPLRRISAYDLKNVCKNCGTRFDGESTCPECKGYNYKPGYGEDTTIFVSKDNLTNNVVFSTDIDSVKNNIRLVAGDDLMTATIKNCNPNGSQYIWYISDEMKKDMPEELVEKINAYDELYAFYDKQNVVDLDDSLVYSYNELVRKYRIYDKGIPLISAVPIGYVGLMETIYNAIDFDAYLTDSMMPSKKTENIDANTEAAKLVSARLSPIAVSNIDIASKATVDNYVIEVAKIYIDHRYSVKIKNSSYDSSGKIWRGNFIVSSYSDDEDKAESNQCIIYVNDDYINFLSQKMDKIMSRADDKDAGVSFVMKQNLNYSGGIYSGDFVEELKKYSLNVLNIIKDCCQSCLDVLIEQGAGNKFSESSSALYTQFYEKYFRKMQAIEAEMSLRQNEITIIQNVLNHTFEKREQIQKILDFEKFIGDDLWKIFVSYRRDDIYENNNFISDGLTNSELFENAIEFIKNAQKEITKSATAQHSIKSTLNNLLTIKEFKNILEKFEVGNWIRVKVDDNVYKLRLLSFEVDFDNLENINVEFSDVERYKDGTSDVASVLENASSMSSSFPYVARQSSKGKDAFNKIDGWTKDGMALTATKIMNDAYNQDHVWDEHGFLFRKYDSITGNYEPIMLKVINSTLAITDDNWETTKAAVGHFLFKNPQTGKIESAFGVNAETIVGTVILGEKLGIYNSAGTLSFDTRGFIVSNEKNQVLINPNSSSIFTIKNENTNILSFDENGNGTFTGNIVATSLLLKPNVTIPQAGINGLENDLKDIRDSVSTSKTFMLQLSNEFQAISADSDGNIESFPVGVKTKAKATFGSIDLTNDVTWNISASIGIYGSWNEETYEYTVTGMSNSVDSGFVDISCEYISNLKTLSSTKRFTISKVKSGIGISSVTNYYLSSASNTGITTETQGWETTPQGIDKDNQYLWNYEKITYSNGNTSTTTPTIIGVFGDEGKDGKGISGITEYYYASTSNSVEPSDNLFSTTVPTLTGTNKYLWNYEQITYTEGEPEKTKKRVIGVYGDKGESSYSWIKYAEDANGKNMSDSPNGKTYIGIAYNKQTPTASTTESDYTWKKFVGEDGDSTYTWVKYADDANGTNMTDDFTGKKFIGLAFGKNTATESTNPKDYNWSKYIGDDGVSWEVELSELLVIQDSNNNVTPSSIVANFYKIEGGTRYAFSGRLKVEYQDANGTWQSYYSSNANITSYTLNIPTTYKQNAWRFMLYQSGGFTTLLDMQGINVNHELATREEFESSKVTVVESTNDDGQTIRTVTVGSGTDANQFEVIDSDGYIFTNIPVGDKQASGAKDANDKGNSYFKLSKEGLLEVSNALVYGTVYATSGVFSGTVYASNGSFNGSVSASSLSTGSKTGQNVSANGIYINSSGSLFAGANNGVIIYNTGYFQFGGSNGIVYNSSGLSIGTNATFAGSLSAATGTFSGSLSAASGTFTGTLSGASGSFSGDITANSLTVWDGIKLKTRDLTTKKEYYIDFVKYYHDEGEDSELLYEDEIHVNANKVMRMSSKELFQISSKDISLIRINGTRVSSIDINGKGISLTHTTGEFPTIYEEEVTINDHVVIHAGNWQKYITNTGSVDLTGYATQSWVKNQGYITSSSLSSDYVKKTSAGNIELTTTNTALRMVKVGNSLHEISLRVEEAGTAGIYVSNTGNDTGWLIKRDQSTGEVNAPNLKLTKSQITDFPTIPSGTLATQAWVQSQGYSTSAGTSFPATVTKDSSLQVDISGVYGLSVNGKIQLRNWSNGSTYGLYNMKKTGSAGWMIYIDSSGNVVSNASDKRLKVDCGKLSCEEASNILKNVPIINYVYKEDVGVNNMEQNGIFAQDLRDVLKAYGYKNRGYLLLSNLINKNDDKVYYDINLPENNYIYSINYSSFIPLLWKGWQMNDARIKKLNKCLEEENAKLKFEIEILKSQNSYMQLALQQVFVKLAEIEKEINN